MSKNLLVIEDKAIENLEPITSTRTSLELQFGALRYYDQLKNNIKFDNISLVGRKHLMHRTKNNIKDINIEKFNYEGDILVINSQINLNNDKIKKLLKNKEKFIAKTGNQFVCARIQSSIIKNMNTNDSYKFIKEIASIKKYSKKQIEKNSIINFPWEYIKESGKAIKNQYKQFNKKNKNIKSYSDNKQIWVSKNATIIEKNKTYLDSSEGPVIIDEGAIIEPFTYIKGPVYIGKEAKINGARIYQNTSIGKSCNIGGEVQKSIIFEYTNKSHEGYIGHSIIGSWVNIGARTTNSDLKNTYGKIKINIGNKRVQSNEIKFGCIMGDNSKTSIGSLVLTGIKIGVGGQLLGIAGEDIPAFTFYSNYKKKNLVELDINKVIRTQARMMKRREINQNIFDRKLLREIYNNTIEQRKKKRVKVGNMKI